MSEPEFRHTTHIRVRYADTDQMGVVYYGKYFEYFEVARTELLRSFGMPYSELERSGTMLPVAAASAKYYKGAKYDDLLEIVCSMPRGPSPKLEIAYEVRLSGESPLLVEGRTTLVFVDVKTGKPIRPPAAYLERLEQAVSITDERGL